MRLLKTSGTGIGAHAEEGFQDAEFADGIEGVEGITIEMAVVENTGETGADEEVVGENGAPHLQNHGHFGEETVPSNIEEKAFVVFCTRESSGLGTLLEDRGSASVAREFICGSEPSRSTTNNAGVFRSD